ncbi:hypothetical protein GGS20DRAFT_582741 [Poronia punctata]|nr:hypothetical protein GGS20DRAFT_582741 [Poronia punctata]
MEVLARKRARANDSLPSTKKPRQRSPVPGSYAKEREQQAVVARTEPPFTIHTPAPLLSFPFHLAATGEDDTYQVTLRSESRWNSILESDPSDDWVRQDRPRDAIATALITSTPAQSSIPALTPASPTTAEATTPESATTESAIEATTEPTTVPGTSAVNISFTSQQGEQSTIVFNPGGGLTFPAIAIQSSAIGCDDGPHAKLSVERWATHSALPPFVSRISHPSMSYTDAHSHSHSQSQSTALDEHPFAPGNVVADFAQGFTNPGFSVSHDNNFEPLLIDAPTPSTSVLLHSNKLHLPGDGHTLSTLKCPVPVPVLQYQHYGQSPNHNHYLAPAEELQYSTNHGVWYDPGTSAPSIELVPAGHAVHNTPMSRQSHIDHPGFGASFESSSTDLDLCRQGPIKSHMSIHADRPRRSRGHMQPEDREETSKTRRRKACIRCRMQKIRCVADPCKPETECCLSCRKVLLLETKKVIHRIPCLRWNLNEVVLFRVGGLNFTKRWAGVCVENIDSSDWVDERVVTIGVCITKLPCDPLRLKVRRFRPKSTDVQHRHWKDEDSGTTVVITMPPYALADVNDASEQYRRHVAENAEEAIRRLTTDASVNKLVRQTFYAALEHAQQMTNDSFKKDKIMPARLFRNYFRLWFASRFTLGSAYVTDGHENLEGGEHASFYGGKPFLSRMITAQFDSIGYKHVLVKLKRAVLDELWVAMQKRCPDTFFTVYLIVFMMLHEVAVACQDRRRRAREQGLATYYDLEEATAKMKHGADIILGHWHYYKGDLDPLAMSSGGIARAFGDKHAGLIQLLMATCREYQHMRENSRGHMDWEDEPLYLVSQMFDRNWRPMHSCWP